MSSCGGFAGAIVIAVLAGGLIDPATAASYADMRSAAVKRCEGIDPSEYQSGLVLNPEGNENIRIFGLQADIRKRFPRFELTHPYRVRGTLILDVGTGGQGGMWSDAFIERVFPVAARSQILVKQATF